MSRVTRRCAVKGIVSAVVLSVPFGGSGCGGRGSPEDEIAPSERAQMAAVATAFMRAFDVPGLAVAIARKGRLVYEDSFGEANRQSGERVTASSLFRIASVSKPITATAIFTLIERGRLRQNDKVFGAGAVLGTRFGAPPYKSWVEEITIDHLLTHTCGGWDNSSDDPMFENLAMHHAQLIGWTLDTKSLQNPPGTHYAYSNFGYCVLGRVIEQVSGRPYGEFVHEEILARCDVRDMRIAGNNLDEGAPGEVIYYGQNGENPYDMNVARMDSHGGWLATATDLVAFLNHVDGFKSTPNILRPETIRLMTTPSAVNSGYARGWAVNNAPNWWHSGSLPGTTTIMVRTASGFCWAALTNTRRAGQPDIGLALDNMVWEMARKVGAWKP
ncbi:MAG TPA: serine hydrolase domain-containing protein [Candidatus Acidoferrum sp.]|jgi:CubicO group peptidase (beta-lactamase class C family)